jgi:polyvinyl alcohol dehydrogenase (cytochrome)
VRPEGILVCISLLPFLAAAPSGEEVYRARCAACHDQDSPRIPQRKALEQMPARRILRTLDYGAMISVAYTMSHAEREAVASYLGTPAAATPLPAKAFCADRTVRLSSGPKPDWNGWSPTSENLRFQNAAAAALALEDVRHLKLKWAFAFDGDTTAFSQPTILNGTLFTGSAGGVIHALDAATGCVKWTFEANGPVRSALLAVPSGDRLVLLFGDQNGQFYALDAATGRELWKKRADEHDATRLTGTPVAYNGTVFIPVATWEENRASAADYPCCTARGSVLALRVRDGTLVWKTYMTDTPKLVGPNQWGPSGAGIWSAPTVDRDRGLLYVTTGDNYSAPATETSDAVVALELKTGRIAWSHQFVSGDVFNGRCAGASQCGPDFDFGSSAMLVRNQGKTLLVEGQKSGIVYALDPDRKGAIVWQSRVGKGGTNGGVQWGMASDGQKVYAAVSDVVRTRSKPTDPADLRSSKLDPEQGGGLTALRLSDGSAAWYAPSHPCETPRPGCSPAQPAAVTAIPGAVFSGAYDGHLRAFSTESGALLWDFDTARDFETVNGIKGHGGSIDGPGAVVVQGMVFVNSGYARQNGMPGNVLLAFGP